MPIHKEAVEEGMIIVEIGTLGAEMRKFTVKDGTTVSQLLTQADYPTNSEVRCNQEIFKDGDVLTDGDVLMVLASEKVVGGLAS